MRQVGWWLTLLWSVVVVGCYHAAPPVPGAPAGPKTFLPEQGESHFGDLQMLTDGGENAEAYFAFGGKRLIFQSTRRPWGCDQILSMNLHGGGLRLISTGQGRTTCAYFLPGDKRVLYASTHLGGPDCPPPPDRSHGYVWAIYPTYDIFVANADGSDPQPLTRSEGYDAEATISPRGDRIVFTSMRDGDLELYTMNLDGSDVRRLTHEIGYDGGAFFSPDGKQIVYRCYHPSEPQEIAEYQQLLAKNLVRPSKMDIWVMDADGSNKRQVTKLGVASFAPYFHPSGRKIVFSSNYGDAKGREFDLWMVDTDGSHLEQITRTTGFDGFPIWSPDGKKFVFCSNRHNSKPGETNVFITDWKD